MKKEEFCKEIINQVNYILGSNASINAINEQEKIIVIALTTALANYCNTFSEYNFYISKLLNKNIYFDICFEDMSLN